MALPFSPREGHSPLAPTNPSNKGPRKPDAMKRCIAFEMNRGFVVLIDEEDEDTMHLYPWRVMVESGGPYCVAQPRLDGRRLFFRLHRVLLGVTPRSTFVDHINGNTLDNRRSNLRVATPAQNLQNIHARWGASRFKGVTPSSKGSLKPWMAQIRVEGKSAYLGTFSSEEDAARAYDSAAREHFGQFANTNFEEVAS